MDDHIPPERHFHNRPAWQRLLVFVAGPLFNLVLAFLIYTGLVLGNGLQNIPFTTVGAVHGRIRRPRTAGFLVGDEILAVDGEPVDDLGRDRGGPGAAWICARPEPVPPAGRDVERDGVIAGPGTAAGLRRRGRATGPWAWSPGTPPSAWCRRTARPPSWVCRRAT